jgi:cAMP-dependent protein kinase regulator
LGKRAFVRLLGPVVEIIKRNSDNYQTIEQQIQQQKLLQEQQQQQQQQQPQQQQHQQATEGVPPHPQE